MTNQPSRPQLSPEARRACASVCGLFITVAAVRLAALVAGHPGNRVSLTLAMISGAGGCVGLATFLMRCRAQRVTCHHCKDR